MDWEGNLILFCLDSGGTTSDSAADCNSGNKTDRRFAVCCLLNPWAILIRIFLISSYLSDLNWASSLSLSPLSRSKWQNQKITLEWTQDESH